MSNEIPISEKWDRLSPLSLIHHYSKQIPSLLITLYFAYNGSGENLFLLIIAIIFGLFIFPLTLLNYYYFRYLITPQEIKIYSGVISKKQRVIPIKKIQNVVITQNFLQRILKISRVQIETAGETQSEGILESVSNAKAVKIKEYIQNYQANTEITSQNFETDNFEENESPIEINSSSDIYNEKVLINFNIKDLLIFGLLRLRPMIILPLSWLFGVGQQFFPDYMDRYINSFTFNADNLINGSNIFEIIIVSIVILILSLIVSILIDLLLTINQWWNFKLSIYKDKLLTTNGLLNRKQGTIPLKKLQMVVIYSNYIREKFGYWGLMLETAGLGSTENRRPETAIPFAKFDTIKNLISEFISISYPFNFISVSRKTIRRAFNRYLFTLSLFGYAMFLFDMSFYYVFLLIPALYYIALLRWQHRGWELQNGKIIIKQGFFFKKIKIIPLNKIQTLNIKQSFFQRKLQLSTFHIDTAASSGINDASIIDIDEQEAHKLFNIISNELLLIK